MKGRLSLSLICGMMLAIMVASQGDIPGEPGPKPDSSEFPEQLRDHLLDMKDFFCPWCIPYCFTGKKPDPPPGSTAADRPPPQTPFDPLDVG